MKDGQMKRAFTIIEVILVLSISSLFAVSMMVGWNINIERQRYNDTVNTLKSDIQGIFNEVENPTNARQGAVRCSRSSISPNPFLGRVNSDRENRGSTNCIVLGKLAHYESSSSIYVRDIIGFDINTSKDCGGLCVNHRDAILSSSFVLDESSANNKRISIQWNNTFTPVSKSTGFIVLRSPLDNSLFVYNINGQDYNDFISKKYESRKSIISDKNILNDFNKINLCINSDSNPQGRNKIISFGGTISSVEVLAIDSAGGSC